MADQLTAPTQDMDSPVVTDRIRCRNGISLLRSVPAGEATAVALLLHGIGGNAHSCAETAEILAGQGILAYSWDAPGYGESDDPHEDVDLVATLVEVLDDLRIDAVDLFGTSWGGVIAAQVADRFPRRVRSLVLADSTRGSAPDPRKAAAMRSRVAELCELGAAEFAARRSPRLVSPAASEDAAAQVRDQMARVRPAGYRVAAEFMASSDNTAVLERLEVPTLVVVGADDVVTGVEESRLLSRLVPGARFEIIPAAGHAAVGERPQEMAAALIRFWEGLA